MTARFFAGGCVGPALAAALASCTSAPAAHPDPAAPPPTHAPTTTARRTPPPPLSTSADRASPPPPSPTVTVRIGSLSGTGDVTPGGLLRDGSLLVTYAIEGGGIELFGVTGTLTIDGRAQPIEGRIDPGMPRPLGPGPIGVVHALAPVQLGPVVGKGACSGKLGVLRVAVDVRHSAGVTRAEGNFVATCGGGF